MAKVPTVIIVAPQTDAEYAHQQRRFLASYGGDAQIHDDPTEVYAYVNAGRWVADCVCGSASLVHPSYQVARCGECGKVCPLVFPAPADREQIEAVLLTRPMLNMRNWQGESLSALSGERL